MERLEDQVEVERQQALFEPAEAVIPGAGLQLVERHRDMEAIDGQGAAALEFEQAQPGGIGLQLKF